MRGLATLAFVAALAGCAGATPTEYHRTDDIKPGPGMLSGPSGMFTYRKDLDAERAAQAQGKPAAGAAPAAAAPAAAAPAPAQPAKPAARAGDLAM